MIRCALPFALLLVLGGCSVQPQLPGKVEPARQHSHPRYAPPPGGNAYWDQRLGVYVLQGRRDLYYRERVYYRWSRGWSWANTPQGPWQPTDSSGVPAGLGRSHAN